VDDAIRGKLFWNFLISQDFVGPAGRALAGVRKFEESLQGRPLSLDMADASASEAGSEDLSVLRKQILDRIKEVPQPTSIMGGDGAENKGKNEEVNKGGTKDKAEAKALADLASFLLDLLGDDERLAWARIHLPDILGDTKGQSVVSSFPFPTTSPFKVPPPHSPPQVMRSMLASGMGAVSKSQHQAS
jgi:hypothetical protein